MQFNDKLTIDTRRRTRDGYSVVTARVARGGNVQLYSGAEVGKPEMSVVRVYRPADEVFAKSTMDSFAHKPVTVGHPDQHVSADNWRQHAVGHIDGEVVREGDFVRVPLILMDAEAIKAVDDGTRELSMGYDCALVWEAGVSPSGQAYDAFQRGIRSNHVAIVSAARGGSELRIGDSARKELGTMTDSQRQSMYDSIRGMPLKDAAALPIFDEVRGLRVSNMDAAEYYAIVNGAVVPAGVVTGDQAMADAAYDQMVADLNGSWRK
jgi:hypothetical protein